MSEANQPPMDRRRLRPLQRVDAICDEFEAKWGSGEEPEFGDYLGKIDAPHRPRLFLELLRIDMEYREDDEVASRRDSLHERYPEFRAEIESVLPQTTGDNTVTHSGDLYETQSIDSSSDQDSDKDVERRFDTFNGMRFGGYQLLDEIARGGMGVVFRANQIDVNRTVAIKMILNGDLAGRQEIERFKTEAEAAAKLDHPNIVPIFEVGQQNGKQYFSMAYVDGPSLKQLIRDRSLGRREAADVVRKLAIAIDYAHGRGVVHRDLKPANVLMDAGNNPRITDFGLSKLLDGNDGLTGTGELLGTPAYMSPEQASGNMSTVGPLSDVYSLGAILYELITGSVPFKSESIVGLLSKIRSEEPASLRSISRDVDFDIETICIKCLDKEPQRRYATAGELAEDLGRYLSGEPVQARPITRGQKLIRWCKRRPVIASLAVCLAASLVVFGGSTTYFALMSRMRGSMVESEREQADEMLNVAQMAIDQMVEQADLLADVPRTELRRKELLDQATQFYQGFLNQRPKDSDLILRSAVLHRSMGNMFLQLGEFDSSRRAFETSIRLLSSPTSNAAEYEDKRQQELAESFIWLGNLLKPRSSEEALMTIEKAVLIQEELSNRSPDDPASKYGLARALYNRGMVLGEQGNNEASEKDFQAAIRLLRVLVDHSDPDLQQQVRLDLGRALNNYGNLLKKCERPEDAKQRIADAIDLYRDRPLNREQREDLAVFQNNLSNTLTTLGMLDEAASENEKAIEVLERLVEEFPQYTNLKSELSNALNSCGALAGRQGKLDRAAEMFARSDLMLSGLTEKYANHSDYANRLGNAKYNQAVVHFMQKRFDKAKEFIDQATDLHASCLASNAKSSEFAANLKKDYSLKAQTCLNLVDFQELIKVIESSVGSFPADPSSYFQASKWLARGSQSIRESKQVGVREHQLSAEDLADQAVDRLRSAIALGQSPDTVFDDDAGISEAFLPLQDHPEFRQLLSDLKANAGKTASESL